MAGARMSIVCKVLGLVGIKVVCVLSVGELCLTFDRQLKAVQRFLRALLDVERNDLPVQVSERGTYKRQIPIGLTI